MVCAWFVSVGAHARALRVGGRIPMQQHADGIYTSALCGALSRAAIVSADIEHDELLYLPIGLVARSKHSNVVDFQILKSHTIVSERIHSCGDDVDADQALCI